MTATLTKCLLLTLLLVGCTPEKKDLAPHIRYAHEIVESFAKEMARDFDLVLIGTGGSMPDKIEQIEVEFAAYRIGTIEEARKLEIQGTERLLQKINAHRKIRPYLASAPFQSGRANIAISFQQNKGSRPQDGSVAYVFQARNKIFYCASGPSGLVDLLNESYEDALKSTTN